MHDMETYLVMQFDVLVRTWFIRGFLPESRPPRAKILVNKNRRLGGNNRRRRPRSGNRFRFRFVFVSCMRTSGRGEAAWTCAKGAPQRWRPGWQEVLLCGVSLLRFCCYVHGFCLFPCKILPFVFFVVVAFLTRCACLL